jgi:hypothetical protein
MTFTEAYKLVHEEKAFAVRRKSKPSHKGSDGNGYVDAYYLLHGCCNRTGLMGWECSGTYLTPEDIIAEDWEVK